MEVQGFFVLLQSAGSETTARLLGWSAVLLARHPEQRAKLVADRSLLANAVEELLRYEAPSPIQARYVTRDVELYGVTVPAGSKMALLNGSAGRDEREYPDPDRFDVTRHMERHMTFGYSTHFCLGAALARLEGRGGDRRDAHPATPSGTSTKTASRWCTPPPSGARRTCRSPSDPKETR